MGVVVIVYTILDIKRHLLRAKSTTVTKLIIPYVNTLGENYGRKRLPLPR